MLRTSRNPVPEERENISAFRASDLFIETFTPTSRGYYISALRASPGRYPDKVATLSQPLPKGEEKTAPGSNLGAFGYYS